MAASGLSILKNAYREFENRVDQMKSPRGVKTEQVEAAVKAFSGTFTLYELECACMGVSRDRGQLGTSIGLLVYKRFHV